MLHVRTADGAMELGVRIVEEVGARHDFPVARVRMHSGPAVSRGGNWFGAAVNLAARVAAAAGGAEVLLTTATRTAGGALAGIERHERGHRSFKNVAEPVVRCEAVRLGT